MPCFQNEFLDARCCDFLTASLPEAVKWAESVKMGQMCRNDLSIFEFNYSTLE